MFFSRRISCVVGSRKALGRTPRISKRARRRRWTPTVAGEQLETRPLLSETFAAAAVTTPAVTSAADPPPAPTITVPAPENNIQRGPMGFTVDSNGNVAIVGPGTGTVLGAVNSSGFVNVTGVTLGADGISGTFSFTGQIVIAGGQASLTNGTYTATYSWGGAAWQTQVGSSPSNQPASPPPVATGSGTWHGP